MTLAEAIYTQNRPYKNIFRGAVIHKIGMSTAELMAGLVIGNAPKLRVDDAIPYLTAAIHQESKNDPRAKNQNFTTWEAMLGYSLDPGKGDYGACMFKLRYIRVAADSPELHGLSDVDVVEGFLFNPRWAVPKMAIRYANNISLFRRLYPNEDPRRLATLAYNRGTTGAKRILSGEASAEEAAAGWRHVDRVMAHFDWFRQHANE